MYLLEHAHGVRMVGLVNKPHKARTLARADTLTSGMHELTDRIRRTLT